VSKKYLDCMCITIQKIKEGSTYVDYCFTCNVYSRDFKHRKNKIRQTIVSEARGVLRINKDILKPELLTAMEYDENCRCFWLSSTEVIRNYKNSSTFPEYLHHASG